MLVKDVLGRDVFGRDVSRSVVGVMFVEWGGTTGGTKNPLRNWTSGSGLGTMVICDFPLYFVVTSSNTINVSEK